MADSQPEAGGFLHPSILSPPPSVPSTTSALPTPRSHPLKPRGQKETAFISYVDKQLLEISGRFEKRFNAGGKTVNSLGDEQATRGDGYENFSEVAKDLDSVLDVVWVSGTRRYYIPHIPQAYSSEASLQIPFLLNIAGAASSYLPVFSFAPKWTFRLVQKLDVAFSSLINEVDVETGDALPGFETGRKLTMTEKIRLRGIVERTRLSIARVASMSSVDGESRVTELTEDETDYEMGDDYGNESYDRVEMEVARVYERTLVDLGPALDGAPNIGIPD